MLKNYAKKQEGLLRMKMINKIDKKTLSDQYDEWLAGYQQDIKKIIGKYRKPFHRLDPDEIASQANLSLIKYKEKMLNEYEGTFDYSAFQKMAFTYIKNIINWSHYAEDNKKYNTRRVDAVINTEDGPKTTFEMVVNLQGQEDEEVNNLFVTDKYKKIIKVITKYYDILTENEVRLISMMQKGMTEEQMAEELEVTRQAVNFNYHTIVAKLRSFISTDQVFGSNYKEVEKGNKAISSFFDTKGNHCLAQAHSKHLKELVLNKPYNYTLNDLINISRKKWCAEYTKKQISNSLSKRKIHCFLKKESKNKTLETS